MCLWSFIVVLWKGLRKFLIIQRRDQSAGLRKSLWSVSILAFVYWSTPDSYRIAVSSICHQLFYLVQLSRAILHPTINLNCFIQLLKEQEWIIMLCNRPSAPIAQNVSLSFSYTALSYIIFGSILPFLESLLYALISPS